MARYAYAFKIQRPGNDPAQIIQATRDILESLDDLGLALPDISDRLAYAEGISARVREAPRIYAEVCNDVEIAYADGTISENEAQTQVETAWRAADPDSPWAKVRNRGVRRAATNLWQALTAHEDTLITDLLRPLVDDAVATIASKAASLPATVHSDPTALAAGGKTREAWATMVEAHHRWSEAHRLADTLRRHGILSLPAGVRSHSAPAPMVDDPLPPIVFRFRHPQLVTPPAPGRDPALALALDITNGAEPGIYTGPDIDLVQLEQEQAEAETVAVP